MIGLRGFELMSATRRQGQIDAETRGLGCPRCGVRVRGQRHVVDEAECDRARRVAAAGRVEPGDVAAFLVDRDHDVGTSIAQLRAELVRPARRRPRSGRTATHRPVRRGPRASSHGGGLGSHERSQQARGREATIAGGAHPFTAPAVRPLVTRRCTSRKKTTTGIAINVEPAITPPQSVPLAPSLNACSHTGKRLVLGPVHDDEGEDELVPRLDEREHAGGDQTGRDERKRDAS